MDCKEETVYSAWLTMIPYIGIVTGNRLIEAFGSPKAVYEASERDLKQIKGIDKLKLRSIMETRSLDRAAAVVEMCRQECIDILPRTDKIFLRLNVLKEQCPIFLYGKGVKLDLAETVGIIGPRRCTQEIKKETARIAEEFVKKGYTVISGMAKGVDSYAQTACVNAGGMTVAVLGNGVDICYPREHEMLMRAIERHGRLLSEYPPGTRPAEWRFPQRNRIIAALSDELVLVGAGERSGAALTAAYATQMGKTVSRYPV